MGRPFREMASERKRLPLRAFSFSFFLSRKFARYGVPALLAVLLAQSSGISLTYILKELVDAITIKDESMWNWAFVYVGLFAVSATLWRTSGFLGMYWITHTRSETNRRLYRWLSQHSSRYFANQFAGSLAGKVSNAANGLNHMLSKVLWDFLPTFLRLFLSMVLAYIANPVMALIMAIWAGLFLVINGWLVKKKAVLSRSTAESYTRLKGQMVDILANIRVVHQFARRPQEIDRVDHHVDDLQTKIFRSWRYSEFILLFNNALQVVLLAIMLVVALQLLMQEILTVGEVIMMIQLTWGILDALLFIGNSMNSMMESYGEVQEALDVILEPHEIVDLEEAPMIRVPKGEIKLDRVSFAYEPRKPLLKDFSLHIPAGQKVGLVGESGAGKSTLTQLLLRMYDIQQGGIFLDGQNIATHTQESLRHAISFVPQSSHLFHRSVRENIAYGKPGASLEEIQEAARKARADAFIEDLTEGYETLVGERGVKLSGGQAQRVSIARSMLKEAPILILDEATSSLDSESERQVQEALMELIKDKTVIAIAHRLSTLLAMDRILVLDQGEIVEDGSHQELLDHNGTYARLWKHQVGGFLVNH